MDVPAESRKGNRSISDLLNLGVEVIVTPECDGGGDPVGKREGELCVGADRYLSDHVV